MSWQLAAYLLLGVALAAGFGWYERRRPDARIVALVGTLAAFAALGRIAFAAVPNVKPTTDIVLVSGYALGGAPGFAVGAIAALASNFFFGQGPWTPWQMVGWGVTGMIGAGLAIVTRRRIRRWPLAIVCFVVGFAFTVLQDFGDWVTYSDHSLGQLGVYVGKGVGFDFVHATGCLVFALALGPSLMRSLQRFRLRLEFTWRKPDPGASGIALIAAVLLTGALALAQPASAPQTAAASSTRPAPAGYLLAAQNLNGGLGPSLGSASGALYSGWAALGLAAAGYNPATVRRSGGRTLLSYVLASTATATDSGSLERAILAIRAAGRSVTDVRGVNLIATLEHRIARDGSVNEQTNWTAFAILAFSSAGVRPPARTIAWLLRQQDGDGGFNFATGGHGAGSDVDDTGAVLEALAVAGPAGDRVRTRARAIAFIRSEQQRDGGFPSQPGESANAQSTAFAVQGLVAAGVNPAAVHARHGRSAIAYLKALTAPDGHVRYAPGSNVTPVWVTAEALMALVRRPLPLAPLSG